MRHVSDFGAIILMDERYKTHNIEISKWLNQRKRVYQYLPELESDLENFFLANGCTAQTHVKARQTQIRSFSKASKKTLKETTDYEYENVP